MMTQPDTEIISSRCWAVLTQYLSVTDIEGRTDRRTPWQHSALNTRKTTKQLRRIDRSCLCNRSDLGGAEASVDARSEGLHRRHVEYGWIRHNFSLYNHLHAQICLILPGSCL